MEKKYIQDKDGTQILPITHISAVRDDAGNTLDSILANNEQALLNESNRAKAAENDRYTKSETYNKTELNNLITTPNQQYVTVTATDQTTAATDVLPATGSADTVYRVGNWDGTQYSEVDYAEYAWNGSTYINLSTKSQVGEVYDISANHADTKYADLAAALGTNGANIPQSLRKGGMSVKFVQSSDNEYVQYRFKLSSWTTAQFINTANWQKQGAEVSATKETSTQKELFVGDSSIGMFAEGAIGKVASKAVLGDELFNASDIPDENIGKAYRVDTVSDISLNDYFVFDIDVEPNKAYNISGKVIKNETWAFIHIGGKFLSSTGSLGTFLYDSTINNVLVTPPNCIKIHFTALYADSNTLSFKEILNLNKTNENVANLFSSQDRQDKELLKSVFGQNFFAETSKTSGQAWRATTNQWNNISAYGHFDFEVQEGDVYYISGYSGSMSPFGFRGNSSVGSGLVVSQEIYGDFYYTVPSGVKQLQISYRLTDTMSVHKIDINDRFANIQSQIDNNKDNVPLIIKDFSDSLYSGGYRYLAFFGGITFNGKEYHCGRISYNHLALHNYYGHLAMFEIDADGKRRYFDPIDDYSVFNGELRDINLSKTRDGQYLILSAGCDSVDESNAGELINSYIVLFNTSLEVVKVIDLWNSGMDGYFAWGNTLETPDHYLLKCGYKSVNGVDMVSLFKSNQKITETTTLTFTKVCDMPNAGGGMNEPTIGYVGSLLTFISRVNSANARICFNETPDGSGTWDNLIDLGHDLQSPCIPLYQKGDIFAFGGGYTNGIPAQGGTRNPFIAYFNASTKQLLNLTQIDTLTHWGGYPSMIDIGGNRYAMMYYDDNGENSRTAVFYQRVNVRYKCNVDYFL